MTGSTIGREAGCSMIWICCIVVVRLMAANTGIRYGIIVIPVMTLGAGQRCMSSCKHIIIVMYGECCRFPSRNRSMTCGTGIRDADSDVIRVCRLVIIGQMTTHAGIRYTVIIPVMALFTGKRCMSAC